MYPTPGGLDRYVVGLTEEAVDAELDQPDA